MSATTRSSRSRRGSAFASVLVGITLLLLQITHAFVPPTPPQNRNFRPLYGEGGGGASESTPWLARTSWKRPADDADREDSDRIPSSHTSNDGDGTSELATHRDRNDTSSPTTSLRGGGAIPVPGSSILSQLKQSWSNLFLSKEQREEQALIQQLQTIPVQTVLIENKSTILPQYVIDAAIEESQMIGAPLDTERVQVLAEKLTQWYRQNGYVLHTVTGATLQTESRTALIQVDEPSVSSTPMEITTCQEMIVDPETGQAMSMKQYRAQQASKRSLMQTSGTGSHDNGMEVSESSLETTLVQVPGRTAPRKIAKALRLQPGQPFRWDMNRWSTICSSGIFRRVLQTAPERMPDGSVKLHTYVIEPSIRHLEYGVGKSLYTNGWQGELELDHQNLFGGGEKVGVRIRRGTHDAEPSVKVFYRDDKLGAGRGYSVEAFSEVIGSNNEEGRDTSSSVGARTPASNGKTADNDELLDRRGLSVELSQPIPLIGKVGASIEQTQTRTGFQDHMASTTLSTGPFRTNRLPFRAISGTSATVTTGTKFHSPLMTSEDIPVVSGNVTISKPVSRPNQFLNGRYQLQPYSSASATTQQMVPLFSKRRPVVLAVQHTLATATPTLPRHEANAMGHAAEIRGVPPFASAVTSFKGTTELRIPMSLPKLGEGFIVLFGDYSYVQQQKATFKINEFQKHSSMGIGVRKTVQGLPLKFDVCYGNGKLQPMFGVGHDFQI